MNRKKLPFGFQVQKEKKDLFKVVSQNERGKSSQAALRHYALIEQRPESSGGNIFIREDMMNNRRQSNITNINNPTTVVTYEN